MMKITRISWQIFFVCLAVTFLSLFSIAIYASHTYHKFYYRNFTTDSVVKSTLIKQQLEFYLTAAQNMLAVDSLCKAIGKTIKSRITVIEPSGLVLGDSETDPDRMENHAHRPEIKAAIKGETGVEQRFSPTLGYPMLYVAIPVMHEGKVKAVLRLSEPLQQIKKHTRHFYINVGLASVTALLLIALASMSIARTLSKPVLEMKNGAERIAGGDLDFRLKIPEIEEIRGLAQALNVMAESLGDRIRTITCQKNELDAILSGMSEGVLATDVHERIITINPAAAEFLAISVKSAKGKWIHDIIRNSSLQRFLQNILNSDSMLETSFTLPGRTGERYINAKGKNLGLLGSSPDGVLMVLHDVTRVKRLEEVRKDFVANVSHELRTPLTSIKGFVETIYHGDYCLPPDVQKFLEIISKKTDRLCSIVDDLLTLSAIEREYEQQEIQLEPTVIKAVLEGAVRTCFAKAESKNIRLELKCKEDLEAVTNADLLEQAVSNLIDNAIKYSHEGKSVSIMGEKSREELIISVIDEGIGIPQEHHQRIFERFYRVDKARSRRIMGTGLGLSIVKNICFSLGGKVTVESEIGKGSIFRIILGEKVQ
ncbi:MAG: cell wall metabolism sensor histidine kinase WalK [Clostridiaceae bacterium]|nr:cell wall metabolism sensor histidine kinase WalK [Clostridiaceae bacterium]